ncbi:MAG: hypothetical protein JXB49_13370 [Bacteroidales bacterium]|nr:hypothetical protein [Bacteroidales bacterium]
MLKKNFTSQSLFILLLIFTLSCKTSNKDVSQDDQSSMTAEDLQIIQQKRKNETRAIFYNMYPPVEMSRLFEEVGAVYDPSILNPVSNADGYVSSSEKALNLGIYGVDLSYARNFEEFQAALEYLTVIHKLSSDLSIPEEYFTAAADYIDEGNNNKDTLNEIASRIYYSTDEYLKSNSQGNAAALIMLGGWIEALYIASNIACQDIHNTEIAERIAVQKYSLNSLIALLSNNRDDITVAKYLLMLKMLKKSFDKIDVKFGEGVNIDTVNKVISANNINISITPEILDEVKEIVRSIRSEIIH